MKEVKALKKVIRAWESLSGGGYYSASDIQSWLINDMSPAINEARKVVIQSRKEMKK